MPVGSATRLSVVPLWPGWPPTPLPDLLRNELVFGSLDRPSDERCWLEFWLVMPGLAASRTMRSKRQSARRSLPDYGDRGRSWAGGARRVLRFAGEIADIVGVNASIHSGAVDTAAAQDSLADRFDEKVSFVREGAGDRFDGLEINAWIAAASLTDDGDAVAESIAPLFSTDPASVRSSPLTTTRAGR